MNPGPPKLNSGGPPKGSPKLHSPKDFGDPRKTGYFDSKEPAVKAPVLFVLGGLSL